MGTRPDRHCTQFLSDRLNLHAGQLVRCVAVNDLAGFRREAESLRTVLASQEMLLSSSDDFCLAPILARASALPRAPADMEERIRDILTIWAGQILDYAHRDYYELVRFYYRKRIEAFLAHTEANLAAHRAIVDDKQMDPVYQQIEQSFVKESFVVAPHERYADGPVQAVREILAQHRLGDVEQPQ